jgi:hypothetical protein
MMHARVAVLTAGIVMAPFGAWGGDLAVCWQKAVAPQCQAIGEIVAAFEGTSKGLECLPMTSGNEVANTIVAVIDAKKTLSSSIRRNQAKVSAGRDDTKTFFDYGAAARVREAQNALDRLTTALALQERGYTLQEIKLIQQATLHGSSGGKRARERAKQAQGQLDILSRRCVAEAAQQWALNH